VSAVVRDLRRGRPPGEIAGRFHRTMAAATLEVCRTIRGTTGIGRVCLSGGVFNNTLLTSDLVARLEAVGFEVHLPREAPVGDGGIALGQMLVANATRR
jgi:hydrogenase maturation protein HypF